MDNTTLAIVILIIAGLGVVAGLFARRKDKTPPPSGGIGDGQNKDRKSDKV